MNLWTFSPFCDSIAELLKANVFNKSQFMKHFYTFVLSATALIASAAISHAAFACRAQITVPGYTSETSLEDFPVLVRLPSAVTSLCRSDGADLQFQDQGGLVLAHEIDTWNIGGDALVWVRLSSLTSAT